MQKASSVDENPGSSPSACEPQTLHIQMATPPLPDLGASRVWLLHLRHEPHGDWDWKGLVIFLRHGCCHFINT